MTDITIMLAGFVFVIAATAYTIWERWDEERRERRLDDLEAWWEMTDYLYLRAFDQEA